MAVKMSPIWTGEQFFTAAGQPLSGGKINTYLAGTTTAQATFTDATGVTPNANPITLDSTGRYSSQIWLTTGLTYKFVLTDINNNTIATEDNLSGINDTSSGVTSEWLPQSTPTFVSGTSFTVTGNQTSTFQVGMRVKAQINSGFIYGTIATSVFTSLTTITVTNDSGSLDATLSAVSVGLLGETNPSVPSIINYALTLAGTGSTYAGALRINTNSNQPAFHAHLSSNQTSGSTVVFDTVDKQNGSGYSNSTGAFTAPVAGWYSFQSGVPVSNTGGTSIQLEIFQNGTQVATDGANNLTNGTYWFGVGTGPIYMNLNDAVNVRFNSALTANVFAISGANTFFSGCLLF